MPSDLPGVGVKSLQRSDLVLRVLKCPSCGEQHVDTGKWATFNHRKHLCSRCRRFFTDPEGASVGVQPCACVRPDRPLGDTACELCHGTGVHA